MDYGTGAIFGCPAHDQRDYDFAKNIKLKLFKLVKPKVENMIILKSIILREHMMVMVI